LSDAKISVGRHIFLLAILQIKAQKFFNRKGNISFHASTSLENIDASTREAASIIDVDKKDVVFQVPVKSFSFKKALMQEHFNENYMESSKFPMAALKGKIRNDGNIHFGFNISSVFTVRKPRK
jgi:hypothetical protein